MSQIRKQNRRVTESISSGVDLVLVSIYLILVLIGCLVVYSTGHGTGYNLGFSDFFTKTQAGKQIIFACISLFIMMLIYFAESKIWQILSWPIYGFGVLLLVLVLVFGTVVNGARAWFNFGFFSFQPAEIAKFGTALALSSFVSAENRFRGFKHLLSLLGIVAAPIILIFLQPDAGSALVFLSFGIMLYREGMPGWPFLVVFAVATASILSLLLGFQSAAVLLLTLSTVLAVLANKRRLIHYSMVALLSAAIIGGLYLKLQQYLLPALSVLFLVVIGIINRRIGGWRIARVSFLITSLCLLVAFLADIGFHKVLKPHQQERLNVWLHPDKCDPRGSAYNAVHARLTIGSGGLTGKGYTEGTMTKLKYVPEQETDFIFTAIGEEHGFIGVLVVISLFVILMWRIVQVAERQRSSFARAYGYCVLGIFFIHFLINIGMTMGLLPIIGIPLPFISAGGSSLIGFTLLLGVFIRFDAYEYNA